MIHEFTPGHPFIERIIEDALNYDHIVIDSFCGIGGFTEGFERTGKYKIIACINHWDVAIATHRANHPLCLHIEEDFRTADLSLIKYMVDKIRNLKPSIRVHGSFGLECTNFSNAKGGMPRDNDSRTLADHVDRYVEIFDFDVMWIENVKEFLLWGPMIPKIVWETIVKGKKKKRTIHFNPDRDDAEIFHSMPGVYCPLHIKAKKKQIISYSKWEIPDPERKSLDFNRWKKHIESFGYESGKPRLFNAADYGVPQHRVRLIMQFNRIGVPAFYPKPTHSKKGLNGLPKWNAIGPCLDLHDEGTDLLSFKTNKKTGKLTPRVKSKQTIKRLIKGANAFIMKSYTEQGNASKSIPLSNPSRVITANRKHFYIINCAWFIGHSKPITEPSATLIARQDKTPQYLVVLETGELAIEVYPHDPPHYVAFKRFMADFGIVSVKMRMLKDVEMLRIQSFKPEKTKLSKSSTDNKKMIGNAVPPELIEAMGNAYDDGWREFNERRVAA